MYDPSSAFTHDQGFQSSVACDHAPITAFDAEALPNGEVTHNSVPASDSTIQHHTSEIIATEGFQDVNLHRETPEDIMISNESSNAKAVPEGVTVQKSTPDIGDKEEIAESRTETSPVSRIEIEGIGHAKDTANESAEAAIVEGNLAPVTLCPSTPRRSTCRRLRPSRGIHPIKLSPSIRSAKRKRLLTLQPSRGVQPMARPTVSVSVVVEGTSGPQVTDPTVAGSSLLASDYLPRSESRKRVAVDDAVEKALKTVRHDEAPVSQNLRPRRSMGSLTEEIHYLRNNFDSVQLKCDGLQSDIDKLEIQLRKDLKSLLRRFQKDTQEAENRFKTKQNLLYEGIKTDIREMEEKYKSESEVLREQLCTFKVTLKEGGLIHPDA